MKFEEALDIIKGSGIFYIQNNDDGDVVAIKRAFDNYGRRIEEKEPELEEDKAVQIEEFAEQVDIEEEVEQVE